MATKANKTKDRIVIILLVLTIGCLLWTFCRYFIVQQYYLSKDARYAITTLITLGTAGRGATVDYEFSIQSKTYSGWASGNPNRQKHYFVKFYPKNPEYNELTFREATEADIQNMPPDGYKKLPHRLIKSFYKNKNELNSQTVHTKHSN